MKKDEMSEARKNYLVEVKPKVELTFHNQMDVDLIMAFIENAYLRGALFEQELVMKKFNIK